ncbi:MAG: TIGR01777 family oxidoreductase [Desulfohalobiaceae bacterium]
MRIFILGGTGFIGSHLISHLLQQGHEPVVLSRSQSKAEQLPAGARAVQGDPMQPEDWKPELAGMDAVINLCGKNIMARWTKELKKQIYDSRVDSTRALVQALAEVSGEKPTLINASAVGYYPDQDQKVHDESSGPGDNFLAQVCVDWENQALEAEKHGARVVLTRFAPVLGPEGGLLQSVLPIFRKGLGGRLGSGKQPFAWVHIQDLVRALELCATSQDIQGPVNVCAPQHIDNKAFTKTLAHVLGKSAPAPVPGFMLKLTYGELGGMLLNGPYVEPRVLLQQGFQFRFPELEAALRDILG